MAPQKIRDLCGVSFSVNYKISRFPDRGFIHSLIRWFYFWWGFFPSIRGITKPQRMSGNRLECHGHQNLNLKQRIIGLQHITNKLQDTLLTIRVSLNHIFLQPMHQNEWRYQIKSLNPRMKIREGEFWLKGILLLKSLLGNNKNHPLYQ